MGSCNYLSYTIKKGSNWYMETGVRDLEVVFFKANSSRFNDIGLQKNQPCSQLDTVFKGTVYVGTSTDNHENH